jgi:hypothetical protein
MLGLVDQRQDAAALLRKIGRRDPNHQRLVQKRLGFIARLRRGGGGDSRQAGQQRQGCDEEGREAACGVVFHLASPLLLRSVIRRSVMAGRHLSRISFPFKSLLGSLFLSSLAGRS